MKGAPEIPNLAKKIDVKIVAGPFVNREHLTVIVVESDRAESVDRFISESGLSQWNKVKVLPSLTLEDGIKDINMTEAIF